MLFTDRLEAGFSVNRIWLAAGFLLGFLTARTEICTSHQLWGYFGLILVSFCSYTFLVLLTKRKEQLVPCYKEKEDTGEQKVEILEEEEEGCTEPSEEVDKGNGRQQVENREEDKERESGRGVTVLPTHLTDGYGESSL